MAQKTYTVQGPFRFRGVEPGETLKADEKDPGIVRALARGSIAAGASESSGSK